MMLIVFNMCNSKISKGQYDNKKQMMLILDTFLAGGRLTVEEYNELVITLDEMEETKEIKS